MLNQKSLSGTLPRKGAFILFLLTLKNSVFPMPNMISLWSYRPLIHYLTSSPPHSPKQSDIREFRMSQTAKKYLKKRKTTGRKVYKTITRQNVSHSCMIYTQMETSQITFLHILEIKSIYCRLSLSVRSYILISSHWWNSHPLFKILFGIFLNVCL